MEFQAKTAASSFRERCLIPETGRGYADANPTTCWICRRRLGKRFSAELCSKFLHADSALCSDDREGYFNPRHHCRACGNAVCGQCSPSSVMMEPAFKDTVHPCPCMSSAGPSMPMISMQNCREQNNVAPPGWKDNPSASLHALRSRRGRCAGAPGPRPHVRNVCIQVLGMPRPEMTLRLQKLAAGTLPATQSARREKATWDTARRSVRDGAWGSKL